MIHTSYCYIVYSLVGTRNFQLYVFTITQPTVQFIFVVAFTNSIRTSKDAHDVFNESPMNTTTIFSIYLVQTVTAYD